MPLKEFSLKYQSEQEITVTKGEHGCEVLLRVKTIKFFSETTFSLKEKKKKKANPTRGLYLEAVWNA